MLRTLALVWVVVGALLAASQIGFGAGVADEDEFFGLAEDKGRDEVVAYCGACHSVKLVAQQGLTRQGWVELLAWMSEEQGMDPLEKEDETLVLDYLAKHVDPASQKDRLRKLGLLR